MQPSFVASSVFQVYISHSEVFKLRTHGKHWRSMKFRDVIARWPVVRQFREGDPLGLGRAVQSERSRTLWPRTEAADHVVQSICPYCAVGCGQLVYVKDGE